MFTVEENILVCPAYSPGPSSIAIIRRPLLPRKAHSSPAVVSHRQGGGAPVLTRDGEHVGGRALGALLALEDT